MLPFHRCFDRCRNGRAMSLSGIALIIPLLGAIAGPGPLAQAEGPTGRIVRGPLLPDDRDLVIEWQVDLPERAHLLHGWYTVEDDIEPREHDGGEGQPINEGVDALTLGLRLGFGADMLTFTTSRHWADDDGEQQELRAWRTAIPPDSVFRWEHLAEPATLTSDGYVMLWRGQWLRGGEVVKTFVYAARVADVDAPAVDVFSQQDPAAGRVHSIERRRDERGRRQNIIHLIGFLDEPDAYPLPVEDVPTLAQLLHERADELPDTWRAELIRSQPGEGEKRWRHLQASMLRMGRLDHLVLEAGDVIVVNDGSLTSRGYRRAIEARLDALRAQRELPGIDLVDLNRRIAATERLLHRVRDGHSLGADAP